MRSNALSGPFSTLVLGATLTACALPSADTGGDDGGPHEELRAQLVRSVAYEAVAPSFAAFKDSSDALASSVDAYASAMGGEICRSTIKLPGARKSAPSTYMLPGPSSMRRFSTSDVNRLTMSPDWLRA